MRGLDPRICSLFAFGIKANKKNKSRNLSLNAFDFGVSMSHTTQGRLNVGRMHTLLTTVLRTLEKVLT